MDYAELLIGIAEISIALAGFTGVVVAFGSRGQGTWHPGDRLRLTFLLEASLTAGASALIALLLLTTDLAQSMVWAIVSGLWAIYMTYSLWGSRRSIAENTDEHGDIDKIANRLTGILFAILIIIQICNTVLWQAIAPFLAAVMLNLAGAIMQFARLIRSAFHN